MIITVPKLCGFCYGVSRAIEFAENALSKEGKLIMFGEIVHNPGVIDGLISKGAVIADDVDMLDTCPDAGVLIRAHGLGRDTLEMIKNKGREIIDGTCPKVKKVHEIVMREEKLGRNIIIIGNKEHPEVKGILGWCSKPVLVIPDYKTAIETDIEEKISVVVQTTFNIGEFERISGVLREKCRGVEIFNTICPATDIRQKMVRELSRESDFAIVVGGKKSSNSKKLFDISSENCTAIQIENKDELDMELLRGTERVLICAGSSTPFSEVETIVRLLKDKYNATVLYV